MDGRDGVGMGGAWYLHDFGDGSHKPTFDGILEVTCCVGHILFLRNEEEAGIYVGDSVHDLR